MKKNDNKLFKIRFFLRKIIHREKYKQIKAILDEYKEIDELFNEHPKYFNDMLCKSYGINKYDSRFGVECLKRDIQIISEIFKDALKNNTLLYKKNDLSINLNAVPKVISEGIFSLNLTYKNTHIYSLSFILLDDFFLITALQGSIDKKEEIKSFTKDFFGLRPLNFILFFSFIFAAKINYNNVCGIKDKYLISRYRRNKKRKGRTFIIPNYDEIWLENTNIKEEFKYFYLLEYEQKTLDEIPSKKRSMYKKRYDFLNSITL